MRKKIICLLLILTFFFNTIPVYADDKIVEVMDNNFIYQLHDDDVDELFLPVLAVPSAFAYVLAALGVAAAGTVVYQNREVFEDFYQKRLDVFKAKCTALGIATDITSSWLNDLASGVVKKSSEVYSALKSWVNDLRTEYKNAESVIRDGIIKGGKTYDLVKCFPDLSSLYEYYYVTPSHDMVLAVTYNNAIQFKYLNVISKWTYGADNNPTYRYSYKKLSGRVVNDELQEFKSSNSTVIDGVSYATYYLIYECSKNYNFIGVPVLNAYGTGFSIIKSYFNKDFTINNPISVEHTIIGNISSVDDVVIKNPGKDDNADVVINWGNVSPVDVIGGVINGTSTWEDVLTVGDVIAVENDKVIGGDEAVDVPGVDVPGVDLGDINDYKLDLTNLFPFCLPFDLIDFFNLLSAEPETPRFEYEMPLPAGKSYTFDIDLSPFDSVASLLRKMETLAFIIGLIFITREKMIRG